MKIPEQSADRQTFLADVIDKCLVSREERRASYRGLRQYYLYGADDESEPAQIINKIYPHLDQVSSFLYAQDTTRFSIEVSKSVSDLELPKIPPLNDSINDEWHNSNTDIHFGEALTWALVYASTFIKTRWNVNHIEPYVVEPVNVGVYREDVIGLDRQEAFVHCYVIPKSQLLYELTIANHPHAQRIVDHAVAEQVQQDDHATGPVDQIITSASSPNVVGAVNLNLNTTLRYIPKVAEPMAKMYELYVFDDTLGDFRVFTLAHPWEIIYDRPIAKMFLDHETPLTQICPFPTTGYFWGISLVERLIPLQQMRNRRWLQIQHMMELQASPPKYGAGFTGAADEIQDAMDSPAGMWLSENPGAKMEPVVPQIPSDLFNEITYIDQQFDDVSGVTAVMSGQGETGVRSDSHAAQLLRTGSSRVKRRAMVVEDSLEKLATQYLKLLQKYSKKTLRAEPAGGKGALEFLPHQFTGDCIVKVDGHSNSPIFMQDASQLAFALFKARAIDRESLLDLLQVPMRELLKSRLKNKIEPQEAAAANAQLQAEKEGIKLKRVK